ncbi:uncharacterized protein LOC134539605 [Bacillus rossius redtenbacheri]|uniref:uncharacterized protein LOC134539605 n=1 Tax=Bacillus rossius redtenbacheri TaxID=93214 RepID=UPI002FDD74E8
MSRGGQPRGGGCCCSSATTTTKSSAAMPRLLLLLLLLLLPLLLVAGGGEARVVRGQADKRRATAAAGGGEADYPDYQSGVRYDEYPVVVPKRTAMLLDKIIVALQKAVDEDSASEISERPDLPDSTMDLQRRGQQKGRVYWRCYFNAVTCFKRK